MTWIISILGIILLVLYGNKSRLAPVFGIFVQLVWGGYVIVTEQWGLLLGAIAFAVVHYRNWRLWK